MFIQELNVWLDARCDSWLVQLRDFTIHLTRNEFALGIQNIAEASLKSIYSVLPQIWDATQKLWGDASMQKLWKAGMIANEKKAVDQGRKGSIITSCNGSAVYFFDSLDRIRAPGYIPSDEDMVRLRLATQSADCEINTLNFDLQQKNRISPIEIVDLGGQAQERMAWTSVQCFALLHNPLYFIFSSSHVLLRVAEITLTPMR